MPQIATKRDPRKWAAAKRDALARMGGKHSARAMQLAAKLYKERGGGYVGDKPSPSQNSLRTWTKQRWDWSEGDTPGQGGRGVYLPSRSIAALRGTSSGRQALARARHVKEQATSRGQQYSQHGLHVGKNRNTNKQHARPLIGAGIGGAGGAGAGYATADDSEEGRQRRGRRAVAGGLIGAGIGAGAGHLLR